MHHRYTAVDPAEMHGAPALITLTSDLVLTLINRRFLPSDLPPHLCAQAQQQADLLFGSLRRRQTPTRDPWGVVALQKIDHPRGAPLPPVRITPAGIVVPVPGCLWVPELAETLSSLGTHVMRWFDPPATSDQPVP